LSFYSCEMKIHVLWVVKPCCLDIYI